jgi:hypothetical protein
MLENGGKSGITFPSTDMLATPPIIQMSSAYSDL